MKKAGSISLVLFLCHTSTVTWLRPKEGDSCCPYALFLGLCTLRHSAGSIKGGTVVALMRRTRVCTLRYSRGLLLGTIRIPAHVGVSTPYYPLFSLRRPD